MVKKTTDPVKKISRSDAANQVVAGVNGKTTLAELSEKANQLIVESGGASKVRETAWHVKKALATAEALGVMKITRPTDVMVERVKK